MPMPIVEKDYVPIRLSSRVVCKKSQGLTQISKMKNFKNFNISVSGLFYSSSYIMVEVCTKVSI